MQMGSFPFGVTDWTAIEPTTHRANSDGPLGGRRPSTAFVFGCGIFAGICLGSLVQQGAYPLLPVRE